MWRENTRKPPVSFQDLQGPCAASKGVKSALQPHPERTSGWSFRKRARARQQERKSKNARMQKQEQEQEIKQTGSGGGRGKRAWGRTKTQTGICLEGLPSNESCVRCPGAAEPRSLLCEPKGTASLRGIRCPKISRSCWMRLILANPDRYRSCQRHTRQMSSHGVATGRKK